MIDILKSQHVTAGLDPPIHAFAAATAGNLMSQVFNRVKESSSLFL